MRGAVRRLCGAAVSGAGARHAAGGGPCGALHCAEELRGPSGAQGPLEAGHGLGLRLRQVAQRFVLKGSQKAKPSPFCWEGGPSSFETRRMLRLWMLEAANTVLRHSWHTSV